MPPVLCRLPHTCLALRVNTKEAGIPGALQRLRPCKVRNAQHAQLPKLTQLFLFNLQP